MAVPYYTFNYMLNIYMVCIQMKCSASLRATAEQNERALTQRFCKWEISLQLMLKMGKTVVKTSYGRLRGTIQKSIEGYNYYAFKGIPYAKPPVGQLRFEDPQPPDSWKEIRDANEYGPPCAQYDQLTRSYVGSDDCLYLNVYVKTINSKARLPVMVWIHGGAFTFGCGDDLCYGPDYLLKKDIVLVTINYRLGVFGFLNLEHEAAPGNQGFKDQIMVLKWIQNNIINFGGDPKNVTVFGESSGGASANYLALSHMAKGLFHKAIAQSGVALNTWARAPNPKSYAHKLCQLLGKEIYNPVEIVKYLKTIDSLKLAEMTEEMRTPIERMQLLYPFGPGVDNKSKNPFMPIPILEAAKKGMDIPCMVGYNNREGIYSLYPARKYNLQFFNENYENLFHPNLMQKLKALNVTSKDLLDIYNWFDATEDNYSEKIVDIMTDMYLVEGYHELIKLQVLSKRKPIYFYKFTYDQGISFTKLILNTTMSGASHFDELPYLFSMRFYELFNIEFLQKGTFEYKLMEQMTEMWTNFAKTGKPTPVTTKLLPKKWPPVTNPMLLRYMDIGSELLTNDTMNLEHRLTRGKLVMSKI